MPVAADGKKICSKCKEEYPATNEFFVKDSYKIDFLDSSCKSCDKKHRYENKNIINKNTKEQRQKNKNHVSNYNKEYSIKNKEKLTIYRNNIKYKIQYNSIKHAKSFANYKTFNERLSIAEETRCDENGFIQVKCTYCGKWINPTNSQCSSRISSLNDNTGRECRFYCSDGCKRSCPIFNQIKYQKGFKKGTSREVDPLLSKLALKRDNYQCQNKECNKTIEEIALHVHHIEGATEQPLLSNDLDNVITYCKTCHKEVHKKIGCSYQDYKCKK